MKNKTVEDIVKEYLKANGYDGLYNNAADCACKGDQLFCCGEVGMECKAGCLQTVPVNSEYEYMIVVVNHGNKNKPCCECLNWARTDGWITRHHPNCEHYNDSLIDVWIVDTGDGICCVDNITELGEFEEIVSIKKSKIHKEVFDYMPEFQGCGNKQYMDKNELQRYLLAKLNKSGIKS